MDPLTINFVLTFAILVVIMTILWLISLPLRNASIIDSFWGTGFTIVAWTSYFLNPPQSFRELLTPILVTIWGSRLSLHLLWRNWGHGEDKRYAAMRAYRPTNFWLVSCVSVFLLQGALMWIVSMPIQVALVNNPESRSLNFFVVAGVIFWCAGFLFEAIGDFQLTRFKAKPENANRVMDRGLWRYTRHPNYFGDFCVWWGIYLIALSNQAWWTIGSPILMSILLLKVSGVTLLEKDIIERRPEYKSYIQNTNVFFPKRPKKICSVEKP